MAYFYSPATIEGSFEIRLTNLTGQVQTVATGAGWITPPAWSPQGDMTTSPSPADSAQPDIPNAARIYSYTLGGTHYFPVDQAAAEDMFSLVPSTPKWVRMLRAFLQHAARQLWAEGFTHFVDFASGLPTEDHIHHVLPDAEIVYSDSDPATYVQAKAMVGHLPNVLYLQHDVRDARSLLESAQVRNFLGGERKVAIGLSGITVFFSPDEISQIFHDLSAWAAPGAKLYVTYETKLPNLIRSSPHLPQPLHPPWTYLR